MKQQSESAHLLVFSQLKWDELPQQSRDLILKESRHKKVYFCEEPALSSTELPYLQLKEFENNLQIVSPHLPRVIHPKNINSFMRDLIDNLIFEVEMYDYGLWYLGQNAVSYTDHLEPVSMQFVSMEETPQHHIFQYSHFSALDMSMSGVI